MPLVAWLLLAAAVISLGGWLYSLRSQVFIVVVPTVMTIHVGETASLLAKLFYKPWFKTKPKPTQGTVTVHAVSPSIASVSPPSRPVRHQTFATFTVAGGSVGGPAIINVDGTSRHGTHDQVNVSVTVIAPLPEDD